MQMLIARVYIILAVLASALGTRWSLSFKCNRLRLFQSSTATNINNGTSLSVPAVLYARAVCDGNRDAKIAWVNHMLFHRSTIDHDNMTRGITRNIRSASNNNRTTSLSIRSPMVRGALATLTAAGAARVASTEQLTYLQSMTAGAVSRSIAQTLMHPANTYKTLLQLRRTRGTGSGTKLQNFNLKNVPFRRLLRGADAQFLLSLPHGAFQFFVVEQVKAQLAKVVPAKFDFLSDFGSSAISTVICSVVSTPQMVITDRLMAGMYPSFPAAVRTIARTQGLIGFYNGWWPALAQKIPSYGLTWVFFQQFKRSYEHYKVQRNSNRVQGTDTAKVTTASDKLSGLESFVLGAVAAAGSVAVMNPMDTIKTRLITQAVQRGQAQAYYRGVTHCFWRILREEGPASFYRSLPPRLLSVVPMIAIQFAVYETMKGHFLAQQRARRSALLLKLADAKHKPPTIQGLIEGARSNIHGN